MDVAKHAKNPGAVVQAVDERPIRIAWVRGGYLELEIRKCLLEAVVPDV